ncbi:YdaS family helix-turn-helix protein [Acetobacter sp. DsW_059]|uniref:transcriptional regulator n=1 Tax=Acetobacter sp. DsW_059 TaxID=1670661 RepID=UPI000A3AECBE|nr:hypothetical protein HK25_07055 [Acetobacter sp. DsW_059]
MSIVDIAIEAAGGASELGKKCGLHRTSVLFWRKLGQIPIKRIEAVENATGIPREALRPDIFTRKPVKTRGKK